MNILLRMAWNGGQYHGWQVQENALAICTVLQDAMEQVLRARPDVKGCSRTDAGVHARDYCVSFHFETQLPDEKLPLALNRFLPPDIRVLSAQRVPEEFHARYSASGKEYRYVFLNSPVDDPFSPGLYYRVPWRLDDAAMHKAGQALVGRHDFAAFQSAGSDIEDTVRTVSGLAVKRVGQRVILQVSADGFLYNMVRIMAGTLLRVGAGRLPPEAVADILTARTRSRAGDTLPAKGLFLTRVFYPDAALWLPPNS